MYDRTLGFAGVGYFHQRAACRCDCAAIAHLTAALGVERSLGGNDRESPVFFAIAEENFGIGFMAIVSNKSRFEPTADFDLRSGRAFFSRSSCPLALLGHQAVEALKIHRDVFVAQDVLGYLQWKTVGIIRFEGDFARENFSKLTAFALGESLNLRSGAASCKGFVA